MTKLSVFVMAVANAATTVLSALPTSPKRPMRTRIVKEVSGAPPASSKGAKTTPGGSRTVDGSGSTVEHRTTHVTKNGNFEYMRPVSAANDGASFMLLLLLLTKRRAPEGRGAGRCGGRTTGRGVGARMSGARSPRRATTTAAAVFVQLVLR